MLSNQDLVQVISDLSYKPGWEFRSKFWPSAGVLSLEIIGRVQHSATLEPVKFAMARVVPPCAKVHEAAFLGWWKTLLVEAEMHELREFARYRGDLIDNPHAVLAVDA
jgi:hypothetical protein